MPPLGTLPALYELETGVTASADGDQGCDDAAAGGLQELDDPTELTLLVGPIDPGVVGLCCDCDAKYGTPTDAPNSEAMISVREAICPYLPRDRRGRSISVSARNNSSSFSAGDPLSLRQPTQMNSCSELADIEWLTGKEAHALLAELAGNTAPLHTTIAKLRGQLSATRTHLLVEQAELRRRATAKFTHPERLYFTRVGLEQATDEWVAAYKANRIKARRIADLCCGVGGDLMSLAKHTRVFGIDRDPISAHFAHLNSSAEVRCTDAADFDFAEIDAWHIDPDRRPTAHRTTSLDWSAPDLQTIEQMLSRSPNAALKLAPAATSPVEWSERCELEWISRDRECKQQVAWHGNLALTPSHRRATILNTSSAARGLAPRTIIGQPNQPIRITAAPARYVFDIDPAVLAARLTGALAAEHNLTALSPGPTYLTGNFPITDPALAQFEVDEILPFRHRQLADLLCARHIGQLEIKKRGVDLDPEKLRRDLKLRGPNAATLLITKIATRSTAILAHRICN
jgi:SAM-dependent methyltransferase